MEDIPNETVDLQQKFQELKQMYHGKIELALAAEYMLDNLLRNGWKRMTCYPLRRENVIC